MYNAHVPILKRVHVICDGDDNIKLSDGELNILDNLGKYLFHAILTTSSN